jgi:hypothetical protein
LAAFSTSKTLCKNQEVMMMMMMMMMMMIGMNKSEGRS